AGAEESGELAVLRAEGLVQDPPRRPETVRTRMHERGVFEVLVPNPLDRLEANERRLEIDARRSKHAILMAQELRGPRAIRVMERVRPRRPMVHMPFGQAGDRCAPESAVLH